MAKDPAFLFYPGDWLGGTMGMTLEEKGAYMEVLMLQFNRGHMEGHMIAQVVGQIWGRIQHKFTKDENGLFFNDRLELEKNRRKEFIASRNNNIKGSNQYTKGKKRGHKTSHMENENENENVVDIAVDIETRKAKFINDVSLFRNTYQDEMLKKFCEYWMEHNPGGKKMRFEMERVFEINRRLTTWKSNELKFTKNGKEPITQQSVADHLKKYSATHK